MATWKQICEDEEAFDESVFEDTSTDEKLNKILASINKMHGKLDALNEALTDDEHGIEPRLTATLILARDNDERVLELESENASLKAEVEVLKGLANRYDQDISNMKDKMDFLMSKTMENNIVIGGILEGKRRGKCNTKDLAFP